MPNAAAVSSAIWIGSGAALPTSEISRVRAVRPQILDRAQLAPPFEEVAHDARLGLVGQRILRLDQDEAVAFGQRDRRRQDLAQQVVPACANPDRNGERQPARERQARVLEEHSAAELHVERHAAQPRQAAAVAQRFLVLLHAPERGERVAPRLVGREPLGAHQPVGFHLDVKPELIIHP